MIQMIDFRKIYENLSDQMAGNQKKIAVNSCIEVFFGYSFDGNLRLSFLSKTVPPTIEPTSILNVAQGRENKDTYWTSFDLLNIDMKEAYFSFCENLIDSITGIENESVDLCVLNRRFITCKKLFQKTSEREVSKEKLMGIFGELFVLKDIIAPKYGINTAILAWGGSDLQSKDFTVDDTWYEVKTIGANSDSIHISSLTQLSSNIPGHLIVVSVEAVSPGFKENCFLTIDIIKQILLLVSDETVENTLIGKIQSIGIDVFSKEAALKFDVKSVNAYTVSDGFPRITNTNVPYPEITDVHYTISRAAISRFAEETSYEKSSLN